MTTFFMPTSPGQASEAAYQELRRQTEAKMGRAPSRRRIMELWTRRGNLDCVTKVGAPDPVSGDIVSAIFDMGPISRSSSTSSRPTGHPVTIARFSAATPTRYRSSPRDRRWRGRDDPASARPPAVTSITEIVLVGGDRLRVHGDATEIEGLILSAARGSIMELAWVTEVQTGQRVGINPDHVLLLRAPTDADAG